MTMNKPQFDEFEKQLKTATEIEPYLYAPLLDLNLLRAICHDPEAIMAMARDKGITPQHMSDGTVVEVMALPNPDGIPLWLIHEIEGGDRWAVKVGVLPRDPELWDSIGLMSTFAAGLQN